MGASLLAVAKSIYYSKYLQQTRTSKYQSDSLSDHFRPQIPVAFLQNKHSRSCILITPWNSEKKLTSHFLATWSVYTVHEKVVIMSKCLHGHWSWSTFAYELYMRRKLMGQSLNVYYSIKQ